MSTSDTHHVTAKWISPTQFRILCDCKRGYHTFGNMGDQHSYRLEHRCMVGHLCDKYSSCLVEINESTDKVEKFPRIDKIKRK